MHDEASFEAAIEADLLKRGWQKGSPGHYRPALGLDTAELMALFRATQAKAFDELTGYYGGIEKAQRKVAAAIDARGTLDVLRRGVKDHGVLLRLAHFAPAHALPPALSSSTQTIGLPSLASSGTPPRQQMSSTLPFRQRHPGRHGELKNQLTGQSIEDAKKQDPTDPGRS